MAELKNQSTSSVNINPSTTSNNVNVNQVVSSQLVDVNTTTLMATPPGLDLSELEHQSSAPIESRASIPQEVAISKMNLFAPDIMRKPNIVTLYKIADDPDKLRISISDDVSIDNN